MLRADGGRAAPQQGQKPDACQQAAKHADRKYTLLTDSHACRQAAKEAWVESQARLRDGVPASGARNDCGASPKATKSRRDPKRIKRNPAIHF
jgi:hypothetical protein